MFEESKKRLRSDYMRLSGMRFNLTMLFTINKKERAISWRQQKMSVFLAPAGFSGKDTLM